MTSVSLGTVTVLVVEPALDDLLPLVATLSAAEFQVTTAETFERAKELLVSDPPSMLLTTLRLGLFNGLHLVLRGKATTPDMAAIVTSPAPDRALQAEAEAMGAAFMVKPISSQELMAAVLRTLFARDPAAGPPRAPFERRQRERRSAERAVDVERRRKERRRELSSLIRGTDGG